MGRSSTGIAFQCRLFLEEDPVLDRGNFDRARGPWPHLPGLDVWTLPDALAWLEKRAVDGKWFFCARGVLTSCEEASTRVG